MDEEAQGNFRKFNRTSSQICPSLEEELLEATLNNNTYKVQYFIEKNKYLVDHYYPIHQKKILSIACSDDSVSAKTVETLLSRADPKDPDDDGWQAIHWASQRTDSGVLDVLLSSSKTDINAVNNFGSNALHIIIREGQKDSPEFLDCIRILVKKGINYNLRDNKNKTALEWAERKAKEKISDIKDIISSSEISKPVTNNNLQDQSDGKTLLDYLRQGMEDDFIMYKNGDIDEFKDYENNSTLLQVCCQKNLVRSARHLLEKGANPDKVGSSNFKKPVEIAVEYGHTEMLKVLLDKYDILHIPEGLLSNILQNIDREEHDNQGCYKAYMDKVKYADADIKSLKLNEADDRKNTPLHYAIRYAGPEIIIELLNHGASLGAKNKYEVMPIQDIDPETLKEHLDNCVIFDIKSRKTEKEDFQVKFNYRSLIPPFAFMNDYYKDPEKASVNSNIKKLPVAETEVVYYMTKSSEFKHLLKHPVIVSLLLMKWRQIQWLFWINLAFYITFVLSLVVYIFSGYIFSFSEEKPALHALCVSLPYGILTITLLLLMVRELFQIFAAPKNYFKNLDNYLEIILIVITTQIAFKSSLTMDNGQELSSLAILLAAFELVLMLGQHPYFSTNVVMLKTVSFNFFKFLIWYSVLIIAFALSFFLVFTKKTIIQQNTTQIKIQNSTDEDTNNENNSFDDPGKSVFKTIIMLTGEFDASDLNFETFPVTSKLIFALFIFMIAIILLNLLNGLAVSDTQIIKNDAELVGHIVRAQHIRYVETMFVEDIFPKNCMSKLSDICCCLPMFNNKTCGISFLSFRNTSLFPKYLAYELVVYPNKKGLISTNSNNQPKTRKSCAPCDAIYLDRDTIRRTNTIVQTRKDEKHLKSEIVLLQEKIDSILGLLQGSNIYRK